MMLPDERSKDYVAWTASFVFTLVGFGLCGSVAHAADVLTRFKPGTVEVGGEIGRRIDITIHNNLLKLDADQDFLAPFQRKTQTSGYIGLGKLIDAAVRFAAYSHNDELTVLKSHLVSSVIEAQQADGYIGMMAAGSRMQGMWDVHEMAYLIYALASDYEFFGQQDSLASARKSANYILEHWSEIPADWDRGTEIATHVSVTGLERTMLRLSRLSDDRRYLDFVIKQRALPTWDLGIVIGRRPQIEGHIYAYLCRCLAQLELYRSLPEDRLLQPTTRALEFLTRGDGMAITGGCGQWEIWTADQDGRGALGETCATAYQLRVFDSLLRLRGDSYYGDLMERTVFNALFAAQSPDGREIRYYSPFEGNRSYHPGDTYCCPCNYRRIVAELPAMVYYRSRQGIAINFYAPSKGKLPLFENIDVTVRQETDYPSSGQVTIHVDPTKAVPFPLQLRIPAWCETARVRVNGQLAGEPAGGGHFVIDRTWKTGDQVTLDMPMPWRLVRGRKRQSGRVAVMRGPLVYCLDPAQDEYLSTLDGADVGRITLDPESFVEPLSDDSVRPGGTACQLRAWKSGYAVKRPGQLALRLTEFPDPDGKAAYFRLQDLSLAVDDELLSR